MNQFESLLVQASSLPLSNDEILALGETTDTAALMNVAVSYTHLTLPTICSV